MIIVDRHQSHLPPRYLVQAAIQVPQLLLGVPLAYEVPLALVASPLPAHFQPAITNTRPSMCPWPPHAPSSSSSTRLLLPPLQPSELLCWMPSQLFLPPLPLFSVLALPTVDQIQGQSSDAQNRWEKEWCDLWSFYSPWHVETD